MLSLINIIVVVLIIIFTLLSHLKGARITLTSIVSFYPASMIYAAIPNKANILFLGTKGAGLFYSHALVYGVIFILVFFSIVKIMQNENLHFGIQRWVNAVLISTSFVILLVALSLHVLPAYDVFELGTKAQNFWTSNTGYLISLIAPILVIWKVSRA
jgi:hypothetical protein